MRSIVISLLVLIAFSQSDFILPFSFSDDLIRYTADLEHDPNPICDVTQLTYCQYAFNQYLGLDSELSYSQGTKVLNAVQGYLDRNVTELNKVCKARTNFYHCLGHSYYSCMNLHTRLQNNNTDSANGFDYIRTFRSLEWICGGGFRETIGQYDCLEFFPTTNSYRNCMNSFNQTVSKTNFCPAVQQTGECLNNAYGSACGNIGGHYGCESFRFVFDKACPELKCILQD